MTDIQFIKWLKERIINVYNENPNADFVERLDEIIEQLFILEKLRK